MINVITEYAINVQVAMAAYADLRNIVNTIDLIDRLKAEGMSEVQARAFIGVDENNAPIAGKGFKIIDQYTDPISGFSGTVFKNRETNEYTFAVRGTQPSDFINDIIFADVLGIALNGQAQAQINAMNAYFGSLITPVSLGGKGLLDQNVQVNVAGHSLGGHLATAFTLFWRNRVSHTYTYNGAGTGDEEQGALLIQLKEILGFQSSDPIPNDLITNLFAEPGLEITAGLGIIFGNSIPLFIEDQGIISGDLLLENHNILQITDSLAVYDLLGSVDTSISVETASNILYAASNKADESLEAAVNAIGDLLGIGVKVNIDNRDELYTRIQAIENDVVNSPFTLSITSLVDMDGNELTPVDTAILVSNAQNNIAYRYALQELNPFVIEGSTSIATDQFYVPHNNNYILDAENFSDEYFEDRARFLALKIRLSLDDKTKELFSVEGRSVFEDKLSGETIITEKDGKTSASSLKQRIIFTSTSEGETAIAQGGDQADRLYGFQGNDILVGGTGQKTVNGETIGDYLEGGDGDDTLYSNNLERDEDNQKDILKGGEGKDIYYVGDTDELEDSDRDVQFIEHGGVVVGGIYEKQEDGSYKNLGNENLKLVINGNDAVISLEKDSVTTSFTIKNFKDSGQDFIDGDYGITLREQSPAGPLEFFGTAQDDFIIDIASTEGGEPGSHIINDISGGEDKEFTSPVQRIEGRGGNDSIQINADIPNLVIYGDSAGVNPELDGNDFIFIDRINIAEQNIPEDGSGGAVIHGEGGNDAIGGGMRDDFLYGDAGHDQLVGRYGNDQLVSGTGNDMLLGGKGRDVLNAGEDNDRLFGGEDVDVLFGLSGDDRLYGDGEATFVSWDGVAEAYQLPSLTYYDPEQDGQAIQTFSILSDVDSSDHAIDVLYGGSGDDKLYGGGDNDYLYDEAHDDIRMQWRKVA